MAANIYPTGVIYKITNTLNGKFYIGQTLNLYARWANHKTASRGESQYHLHRAMRRYGVEHFTIEIIEESVPEILLNDREVLWIVTTNSIANGNYNMTNGGNGTRGWRHTSESKTKIANGNRGKKRTPKQKTQMSLSHLGKKQTPQHIAHGVASRLGRKHTPQHIANVSKGKSSWWVVTDPNGKAELVLGLKQFCRQHNLHQSSLSHGHRSSGYYAVKVNP